MVCSDSDVSDGPKILQQRRQDPLHSGVCKMSIPLFYLIQTDFRIHKSEDGSCIYSIKNITGHCNLNITSAWGLQTASMPHKVWEQTNELEVSIFVMTMSVCDHVCTAVVSILWSGIKSFLKRFCKDGKLCEHHWRKICISQPKGPFSEVSFDYSADLMKGWFPCRLLGLTGAPTPVKPFMPQMLWALRLYIILCFSWPVQQSVQSVCSASLGHQKRRCINVTGIMSSVRWWKGENHTTSTNSPELSPSPPPAPPQLLRLHQAFSSVPVTIKRG